MSKTKITIAGVECVQGEKEMKAGNILVIGSKENLVSCQDCREIQNQSICNNCLVFYDDI